MGYLLACAGRGPSSFYSISTQGTSKSDVCPGVRFCFFFFPSILPPHTSRAFLFYFILFLLCLFPVVPPSLPSLTPCSFLFGRLLASILIINKAAEHITIHSHFTSPTSLFTPLSLIHLQAGPHGRLHSKCPGLQGSLRQALRQAQRCRPRS